MRILLIGLATLIAGTTTALSQQKIQTQNYMEQAITTQMVALANDRLSITVPTGDAVTTRGDDNSERGKLVREAKKKSKKKRP